MLGGEVADVDAGEVQDPVTPLGRRAARPPGSRRGEVLGRRGGGTLGQQVAVQRPGRVRAHAHIRSGALTPSSPRPFSSTVRVAFQSSSRGAVVAGTGSSPLGSTWHSSQNRWADLATFSSR